MARAKGERPPITGVRKRKIPQDAVLEGMSKRGRETPSVEEIKGEIAKKLEGRAEYLRLLLDEKRPLYAGVMGWIKWLDEGKCMIEDRDSGNQVPLVPTPSQIHLIGQIFDAARNGLPVRIVVPKYRRGGISTLVQSLFWFLTTTIPERSALMVAHTEDATRFIFKIAHRIGRNSGIKAKALSKSAMGFDNNSQYECRTAGQGEGTMRGGGLHYLHVSELAYIMQGQGIDQKAMTALINTVPDQPHTIVVIESTGNGPFGEFYRRCRAAADGKDEYKLCFLPWHHDKRNVRGLPDDFKTTEYEESLRKRFRLTDGQLAWRRFKLAQHPSEAAFRREYPITLEECFEAQAGRVYDLFTKNTHVKHVNVTSGKWVKYRAIDWGATQSNPFVCLWIAEDPRSSPRLTVEPDCLYVQDEFIAYSRDEKTGKPLKWMDHAMDCIRMAVVTYHLKGHVHVYRELVIHNALDDGELCRQIHEMSGWTQPDTVDPRMVSLFEMGMNAECYAGSVADRSQPGHIMEFNRYGIPLQAHTHPAPRSASEGQLVGKITGEVEDGISLVLALLSGNSMYLDPQRDDWDLLLEKARGFNSDGEQIDEWLTDEEQRQLRELGHIKRPGSFTEAEYDPTREYVGDY